MDKRDKIQFWIDGSDKDYQTMRNLFSSGDYHWSLFLGHLVIEKLLKALVLNTQEEQPPTIHNLLRLAEKAQIEISDDLADSLTTISTFNIRARYDDYKMDFYRTCTPEYTEKWLTEIERLRKWIKNRL